MQILGYKFNYQMMFLNHNLKKLLEKLFRLKNFVKDALPVDLIGMNSDLMCQYIEAVADRIADLI